MRFRHSVALMLGVIGALGGCGDGALDPDDSLRPSGLRAGEARAMGDAFVGAVSLMLESHVGVGGVFDLSPAISDGTEVVVSVDLSWPCELGELAVAGTTTASLDLSTGSVTAEAEAVLVPRDCRFTHTPVGDGVTMNGDPNVRVDGDLSFGPAQDNTLSGTMRGRVLWEAEDGRSGRCQIDLVLDWAPNQERPVRGTVCGSDYEWGP